MMRAAFATALIIVSSAAWAQSGPVSNTAGASDLNRFVSQANRCPEGSVYNDRNRQCEPRVVCPEGTALNVQTGQCVGQGGNFQSGALVGVGILAAGGGVAIALGNSGKKKTKSP